ncbi:hypothetical protein QBC38DRAFT_458733 [Podospora fimiseda]|uniref:Uncharacterized protein n=1 Tax=Podospora fimiseda TaxID=252190 RepID=A0AAN7BIQ4_9PEZI|nr:hypothetical protein QBC38DRAFT_458733 [Podospora fimiseda]
MCPGKRICEDCESLRYLAFQGRDGFPNCPPGDYLPVTSRLARLIFRLARLLLRLIRLLLHLARLLLCLARLLSVRMPPPSSPVCLSLPPPLPVPKSPATSGSRGLPVGITLRDLLKPIRNTGRIFATIINPPKGGHRTAAASIRFFELSAALIFAGNWISSDGRPRLSYRGELFRIIVPSRENNGDLSGNLSLVQCTRVLVVDCPWNVNWPVLRHYIAQARPGIHYDLEENPPKEFVDPQTQRRRISLVFGSYRSQA